MFTVTIDNWQYSATNLSEGTWMVKREWCGLCVRGYQESLFTGLVGPIFTEERVINLAIARGSWA